ncbi:DUF5696 domain-containing protein [Paenibacillus sp. GCM10027626]|uniref:DUF5696 domain-containing protein n=1 Tax=Paenibacillus sp. GCM10027626 TaxID=3273411 RepID=UPI003635E85D
MATYGKRYFARIIFLMIVVCILCGGLWLLLAADNRGLDVSGAPETSETAVCVGGEGAASTRMAAGTANPLLPGMEAVLENDTLQLYINRTNAEIAVMTKSDGYIWYSNPPNRTVDPLASPHLKGRLSAQLALAYLTRTGAIREYDSYNDSVQYNQFDIARTGDCVTVTYRFGNPEKGVESLPQRISKQRFEEKLLNRLDAEDREQLKVRYKWIEEEKVYERREIPRSSVKKLVAILEKAGYTDEDLIVDREENRAGEAEAEGNAKFAATVQYRLDGAHLIASLDTASLEESETYKIQSIALLESFGAADTKDEGYMFVPDGSGALVNLNNGKQLAQPLLLPVYGEDGAIAKEEQINDYEKARMPVFGMKKNDRAFLAVIEEGDALAKILADVSGRKHSFNVVGSQFTILPSDKVELNSQDEMIKTPERKYEGNLQIRYMFLGSGEANYSAMAACYRDYLVQKHGMKKLAATGSDTPFYLELAGAIPKKENFAGIPYEAMVPLSSFTQADRLLDRLDGGGIQNVHLNFKGWFNGGIRHGFPTKVKLDKSLGSKQEWTALGERLLRSGGGLYPDAAFIEVYGGGFSPSRDAIQHISRKFAKMYPFNPATYERQSGSYSYYLLSVNRLETAVSKFLKGYEAFNPGAISLRDLGDGLHSDFRPKRELTRQEAERIVVETVRRIGEQAPNLMVSGGNAYVLPYASHVLNVPLESNRFQLADESIPFYQMVIHGYVEYASKPYNLAFDQNVRHNILQSLETGSNVYYSWILEHPSILKNTPFNDLYADYYEQWFGEAAEAYREVNAALKRVRGQAIISHEKLEEGVYKTIYENGIAILVNYSEQQVSVGGVKIDAEQYVVEG